MSEVGVEETVACITKARKDISKLGKLRIDNSGIDLDIRVNCLDSSNTRLTSTNANKLDLLASPFLEHVDRGNSSTTGTQHRIQNQAHIVRMVWRELIVVFDRLEGDLVTEETEMEYRGVREQVQKGYEKTKMELI